MVSKIVGGETAELKDFPWLVMIGSVNEDGDVRMYTCGGSLITMSMVLTASHCLHYDKSPIRYEKWVPLLEL